MSRNEHTGALQRTKAPSKAYLDNYDAIFGSKPRQRGSWVQHPETGEFVPSYQYQRPVKSKLAIFVDNMEPYDSPLTGEHITSRRKRNYDLESNGCRPYEGFESENREAMKYRQEQEDKLVAKIEATVDELDYQIENGYIKPQETV